jgi:hypothetical protein
MPDWESQVTGIINGKPGLVLGRSLLNMIGFIGFVSIPNHMDFVIRC